MRLLMSAFLLFAAACSRNECSQNEIQRVEIHFIDWNILTRTAYSPNDVINHDQYNRELSGRQDICKFSNEVLAKTRWNEDFQSGEMNGRLVAKVLYLDGKIETLFADQFRICSIENKKCSDLKPAQKNAISSLSER